MTQDPEHIARLYEIAAFERPLTEVERLQVGFSAQIDDGHVAELYEVAAFERPLDERELIEVELDLAA